MPAMVTPEFKKAFERLNPEQMAAVEAIEGPVMVVAGPGTGKTEVLTLRIANILLKTDTKPENILALTFTESAATNMRKRLAAVIGSPAYKVRIQTFHSFCNDVLQSYPEYFPRIVGSESITEVEATSIIQEIIKTENLEVLRPWGDPMLYVPDILRKIEELKREGLDPEKFKKILKKAKMPEYFKKAEQIKYLRKLEKNQELALIYEKYQEKLSEKRLYDYSDMILEVLNALNDGKLKDLKLILQEEHQYILVDEHQDTNNAQNKILEILSDFHQNPNIFVVGDHKQAIFRFQGASLENFLYFKKLYPKAKLIELFRNYRSTQKILDSAHSLIASETPLKSHAEKGEKIKTASFKSDTLEYCWIAKKISHFAKASRDKKDIAIIYRTNRNAFTIANVLEKEGISYSIESDEDLFADKFVKRFVSLLYAINYYGEDIYLVPALHLEELGLDSLETYKLIKKAKDSRKSIYEILPEKVLAKLQSWIKKSREEDLTQFLETVFRESSILDGMLFSRDGEAFLGIERLLDEARKLSAKTKGVATLAEFVEYLNVLKEHQIFIRRPKVEIKSGAVRLMTAHRAKGLEFDTVFIANASEKSFGSKTNRDLLPLIPLEDAHQGDSNDDERRLFYVALTRAKNNLFITRHENDENGKEILASPFIAEIKEEFREEIPTREFEEKILSNKKALFGNPVSKVREIDKEFVSELFYARPFSVTALNNYLSCPWKYFYRNLLRIPEFQEKYLIYGTAMHSTVEDFFKARLKKEVNKKFLLDSFAGHLESSILRDFEKEEALKKGKESLSLWYDERHTSWILPARVEYNIRAVDLDGVLLSGKLDKVEFVDESEVFVTDYKTGQVRSRNFIEGKTRESNGDMKRQLNFYKILLDLWDEGRFNMTKGIIEFLEPNESGKIKWEEFIIEKSEVDELKVTIHKVADEITSFAFWDRYCDEKDCKYCGYRKLLEKMN